MTKYSYVDDLEIMRFVKHDDSRDIFDYDDILCEEDWSDNQSQED